MAHRDLWMTVAIAVGYTAAVVVAAVTMLLSAGLVREYGPAEGYGNLLWQILPIVLVGLGLAVLLARGARGLARRRRRPR